MVDAVIRDVWKNRRKDALEAQAANERRLRVLSERRQVLIEEFLYRKSISEEIYNEQLNKISSEVEIINLEKSKELMQEEILEGIVAKSKAHLTNLPYCWNRLQSPVRRQFQKLIHPEGMTLTDGILGTAKKSWLFIDFVDLKVGTNTLVPPRINDWNRFEEWANGMVELTELLEDAGIKPDNPNIPSDLSTAVRELNQL